MHTGMKATSNTQITCVPTVVEVWGRRGGV